MTVTSADEFYSIMAVLTREMLEFGLMDANNLINVSIIVDPVSLADPSGRASSRLDDARVHSACPESK